MLLEAIKKGRHRIFSGAERKREGEKEKRREAEGQRGRR
jgi:hypothetical protein